MGCRIRHSAGHLGSNQEIDVFKNCGGMVVEAVLVRRAYNLVPVLGPPDFEKF